MRFAIFFALLAISWPQAGHAQIASFFTTPTAGSNPTGIVSGPDGALWFTEFSVGKIGRIDTNGTIAEYALPNNGSGPSQIAVGADGALWFTEYSANKIGRISTAGVVTEYGGLTPSAYPQGIAAGPDGALWFTESGAGKIGRISTAGVVTEYAIPTGASGPAAITSGSDGALWFTEESATQIGRITTSGAISEYPIPPGGSKPLGITAGPDGALWFVETAANQIGRITVTGAIIEYRAVSTSGTSIGHTLSYITQGPDGALWYTDTEAIGQIMTSGSFLEPRYGNAPGAPTTIPQFVGIATGPDGTIWFTTQRASAIGRLTPAPVTVTTAGSGVGLVTAIPAGITCGNGGTQCTHSYITGFPVKLTASASVGSAFTGWTGGGCSGTDPCTIHPEAATAVSANFNTLPSYALSLSTIGNGSGTVTSSPSGIDCGSTCLASFYSGTAISLTAAPAAGSTFIGWSGGGCGGTGVCSVTIAGDTTVIANFATQNATTLVAAILPSSRSVQVGNTATTFASVINTGSVTGAPCSVAPATSVQASFSYQATDPSTNRLIGSPNTPVAIAPGAIQTFLLALTPTTAFAPTDVAFSFVCSGTNPAPAISGLNTLLLSASTMPIPDVIALVATASNDGIFNILGSTGDGAFAAAVTNVGSNGQLFVSADSGNANLPLALVVCQTNPSNGACLTPAAPSVTTLLNSSQTATYSVFAYASGAISFQPATSRIFVRFIDGTGTIRGATSVAVRTQ